MELIYSGVSSRYPWNTRQPKAFSLRVEPVLWPLELQPHVFDEYRPTHQNTPPWASHRLSRHPVGWARNDN